MAENLPLPADADLGFWQGEIDRAEDVRRTYEAAWQENLDAYIGQPLTAAPTEDIVNVNVDFYQVEQKQAQLFYETPELQVAAKPAFMGQEPILAAHRDLLNAKLGPEGGADVLTAVHKALKNCLCTAGFGPTKIGYQPTLVSVPAPQQPGAVLGLQPDVQVPLHEYWFWEAFSPKKLLIPADWHDQDGDRAPWLGMRFRMPLPLAQRQFNLPPNFRGTTTKDEHVFEPSTASDGSGLAYVDGTELWYKASLFDPRVMHPERYRCLVLIDGLDVPAKHVDSPYQTMLPNGRLSADSLVGNPIHVLYLRDVPDSAYVPSDCQMTRPLVKELSKFRTQMLKERDATRQRILYDSSKLPPEVIAKIVAGDVGDLIGVEEGALAQGVGTIMAPVVTGQSPRQTYIANDYILRDIEKTLAIGANQAGARKEGETTATEIAAIDRNMNVRLDAERARVLRWYLKGVAKFSALICRYMTPDLVVQELGSERAQAWQQWNKQQWAGRVVFEAKPDSQVRLDAARERKFALDVYQMMRKDPLVPALPLVKNVFTWCGLDTSQIAEKPPEKKPDAPNISFRFSGEDLIGPAAQQVREILAQGGIKVSQDAVEASATQLYQQMALGLRDASGKAVPVQRGEEEHGGPTEQVRPLNQQMGDASGDRPGPKIETPQ